jgi:CRP-like cAMP-binding protein
MLAARRLEIVENCRERSSRPRRKSRQISSEVVNRLSAFAIPPDYPKGTNFIVEGQPFLWCESNCSLPEETSAQLTLTHEEIAQVIGTSRETVTRLLSRFKRKRLDQWKGSNLVLTDKVALESSAAN